MLHAYTCVDEVVVFPSHCLLLVALQARVSVCQSSQREQAGHALLLRYRSPEQATHFAPPLAGQSMPVAPVPPEQVHLLVEHTRLRVVVGDTDSYSPAASEHAARHAGQAPRLKYLLPVQDAHEATPFVGHADPVVPTPPEHVQRLIAHTRSLVVVPGTDSYSVAVLQVFHATQDVVLDARK